MKYKFHVDKIYSLLELHYVILYHIASIFLSGCTEMGLIYDHYFLY
jgi:hypothetical protein